MFSSKAGIGCTGRTTFRTMALALAIATCLPNYGIAAEQQASPESIVNFSIPAGDLSVALERFSTQSGIQAMYRQEIVAGKRASAVNGQLSPAIALQRLLSGTGLTSERANARTYVLRLDTKPAGTPHRKEKSEREVAPENKGSHSEQVKQMEEVVVVGSRLGVSPVTSAMPIRMITREQIDRSGAGNISQALSYLSEVSVNNSGDTDIGGSAAFGDGGNVNSSTVQLRGLPRGTTLILINGRRAGESSSFTASGQFDLSTIPLALVERIEVLPAGSSAIYGGDGLSGVVNIVLRQDATGTEIRVRKSWADSYSTEQATVMWGKAWSRGDVTLTANWKKNDELFSGDRSLTANQDFRRFGGMDRRGTAGYPATIYSLAGCPSLPCTIPISQRGNLPGLNSPIAVVPVGQDGLNLSPEDFINTQGSELRANSERHLFSAEESLATAMRARISITDRLDLFTEWNYTKRDVPAYQVPLAFDNGLNGAARATVPGDHPFNPFGVPVAIAVRLNETGIYTSYEQSYLRGLLGARGRLGRFDWELSGWSAKDESRSAGGTIFNNAAIITALASKDPATTINPFVSDGSLPASREFLTSLLTGLDQRSSNETSALTGFIRGRLLTLPAGSAIGLVGAEYQKQELSIRSNASGIVVPLVGGETDSTAYFSELRVPILAPIPGQLAERLALTGALRSESSDRFKDSAVTSALGVEFRPSTSLMVRSTFSTAFRPMLAYSAVQNPLNRLSSIADPRFGGLRYTVDTIATGGVPPELDPERSRTATFGLVYTPSQSWNISMTAWDTKFRDRIAFLSLQTLIDNEAIFPDRVIRDPASGLIESVDGRQVNIALISTTGADLSVDGSWYTPVGSFHPALTATYVSTYEEQLASTSPVERRVSLHNPSGGWAPRWKIAPRVLWDHANWLQISLAGKYISSYKDSAALTTGPGAGSIQKLGNFWTFDANIEVSLNRIFSERSLFSDSRLSLGATNMLNRLPDFCAGCRSAGYDASQYDIMGRTIYLEFRTSL